MKKENIYIGIVETSQGEYYVQLPNENSKFGFKLLSDDSTYNPTDLGNITWEPADILSIPSEVKEELNWILYDYFEELDIEEEDLYCHGSEESGPVAKLKKLGENYYLLNDGDFVYSTNLKKLANLGFYLRDDYNANLL
jgi:hypothetical protein